MQEDIPERRSLFAPGQWQDNEADRKAYLDVISAMGHLAPDPLFDVLWSWCRREADALYPGRREEIAKYVRLGMEAIPDLTAGADVDALVEANTAFIQGRAVDWVYLTACKSVPGLVEQIVTHRGLDRVGKARESGPVILAPFHFGPSEFLVGGVARHDIPVTVMVSGPDRRTGQRARRMKRSTTSADIESVPSGSTGALLRCLTALRAGRALVMFPELSFSKGYEDRTGVPFGGQTIYVPVGIERLAGKTGATVFPCHVERRNTGRYECVIGPALTPGPDLTAEVFAYCEELVRGGMAAEWEFWNQIPYLLNKPTR